MTKILYVHGDDYAALSFDRLVEAGELTASSLWDQGTGEYEAEDVWFMHQALEFGEVDPKFIEWILSVQDYDDSKHAQFYVLEA